MDNQISPVAPVSPVSPPAEKSNKWLKILLTAVGVLILIGLFANLYFLARNQKPAAEITPTLSPIAATPTSNITANWKIYNSEILSFKYPTDLTPQERQKNYLVLLSDTNNPQSVIVSIDARLMGNYVNYEKAITSTRVGLTEIQTQEINNGLKISGKVGPGFGQGQSITITLFKYQQGAIEAETTTTDPAQLQVYNQILSTFKFLDQNQAVYTEDARSANWKTYTNTKYKYFLKYPSGENYTQIDCDGEFIFNIKGDSGYENAGCGPRDDYFSIEIFANLGSFAQNEFPGTTDSLLVQSEDIILAGVTGKQYTISQKIPAPGPEKYKEILLENGGVNYRIIFRALKNETLFGQILATFKFLP